MNMSAIMDSGMKWWVLGAAFFLIGFLFLILFSDKGLIELSRLKEQERRLMEKNTALAGENVDLYLVIERLKKDPEYIEWVARNELGMVRRDDMVVIFPSGAGKRKK